MAGTTRREFLKYGAGLAAAGVLAYLGKQWFSSPSFEDAKKQSELRQEYIDGIVRNHALEAPAPMHVVYTDICSGVPDPVLPNRSRFMKTKLLAFNGVVTDLTIEVYNSAFEFKTEDDFLSTLLDHEYRHVKVVAGKFEVTLPTKKIYDEFKTRTMDACGDLSDTFIELEACSNQIKNFKNGRILPNIIQRGFCTSTTTIETF